MAEMTDGAELLAVSLREPRPCRTSGNTLVNNVCSCEYGSTTTTTVRRPPTPPLPPPTHPPGVAKNGGNHTLGRAVRGEVGGAQTL